MGCKRRTKAVVIAEKMSEDIKGGKYDVDGNALERYAYDKAGNMLKKQILRAGRAGAPRTPQSDDYITTTFIFDDANQLVSSTTDGVTTRYAYDAAGRLVREGSKTYRYGYLDKVMSVTDGNTTERCCRIRRSARQPFVRHNPAGPNTHVRDREHACLRS